MSPTILTSRSTLDLRAKGSLREFSLSRVARFLLEAARVRRERRRLLTLDDRMLKDLGLSRGDVHAEASRSLFDVPRRTSMF